ncbi:MAG TPA: hypothetical protein VE979_19645, partial [Streptosporangiaceae bacterium]|nr:hypothetical protein [Streptosporangiaceae bacterium]
VGVDPQTGKVKATASGSAVNGAAGVYVVRNGAALGLDQGASGGAWGYALAVQRVTRAAPGLPWPHYFVDLSGVGGSAEQAGNLVVIAACRQLAPRLPAQPSTSAPASGPPSAPASGTATSPTSSSPLNTSTPPASSTTATPNPDASPSAPAGTRQPDQGCMRPELIALNL